MPQKDSITIIVDHRKAGVSADSFVRVMNRTLKLLNGLDRQIVAGSKKRDWTVTYVSMNSPLNVNMYAPDRIAPIQTGRALIEEFNRLEAGEKPIFMSSAQHADAKALLAVLRSKSVWHVQYRSDDKEATLTDKTIASIDSLMHIRPMAASCKEVGSVEGSLELASIHGQDHIKVWDHRFDRPVDCLVTKHQFDEALTYLKRRSRVSVRGVIHYVDRIPRRMSDVLDIRELPTRVEDRTHIDDIRPVDITDGVEPAIYLRGGDGKE